MTRFDRSYRFRRPAWPLLLAAVLLAFALPLAGSARAHPGELDQYGGHFNDQGVYHYHKPARDMAVRKAQWLEWVQYPVKGIIRGVVERIDDSSALWLRVGYRPAFQELVPEVAAANRDDHKQLLLVELAHVSPEETGARNPRFADWFRKKVAHELKQKLLGNEVTVHFRVVGGDAGRLRGMVFQGQGEHAENVNLWMVLNGWSFYVLDDGENPYDKQFRQAEDAARRDGAGIWEHIR